jgi:hypothetical protein
MKRTERPSSTALIVLRAVQIGLKLDDLDCLSLGMIYDILTEAANDDYNWKQIATQDDFDRF